MFIVIVCLLLISLAAASIGSAVIARRHAGLAAFCFMIAVVVITIASMGLHLLGQGSIPTEATAAAPLVVGEPYTLAASAHAEDGRFCIVRDSRGRHRAYAFSQRPPLAFTKTPDGSYIAITPPVSQPAAK